MSASDSGPAAPTSMSADELVRIGFATVRNHPVLLKKLTLLRRKATPPREFRTLVKEITFYLGYEATRTLTTRPAVVETPLGEHEGVQLAQHICICPVLRAGLGMLDPMTVARFGRGAVAQHTETLAALNITPSTLLNA